MEPAARSPIRATWWCRCRTRAGRCMCRWGSPRIRRCSRGAAGAHRRAARRADAGRRVQRELQRISGGGRAPRRGGDGCAFEQVQALCQAGRNGIWPYVLRNLVRPLWLSRPGQLADVVLGNPPWVAYRHLSAELKPRLRDACSGMNLWVGAAGHVAGSVRAVLGAGGSSSTSSPAGGSPLCFRGRR